ncbi:MAG TPA: sulfotransferase [Microthrixaceae bacterium]|nr:sulfotransferase [Microthrixaceae bacterium]
MTTSRFRPLPDFVVIGAKRCGTTSLYRVLEQHPGMMPLVPSAKYFPMAENMKGVHWFDRYPEHSDRWYRSHFATSFARNARQKSIGGSVVSGEASPYYMFHPRAIDLSVAHLGDAKLVVMLRNPVDRAHSHYKEQVRNNSETLSFEDALAAEAAILEREVDLMAGDPSYYSYLHENRSYVAQSMYGAILSQWFGRIPSDRFKVIRSEDFYSDPQKVLAEVLEFLGLEPFEFQDLSPRNAAPGKGISAEVRQELWSTFQDDVSTLESLCGRSFLWDQ